MANLKLEVLRRINCLGYQDIETIYEGCPHYKHIMDKYEECCKKPDKNFRFIFEIDEKLAEALFTYIGFDSVELSPKKKSSIR